MIYAVGGDNWAGTLDAVGTVWELAIPPVLKLLALFYADSPGTPRQAAGWIGVDPAEAELLTDDLVRRGIVGPYTRTSDDRARPMSWRRVRDLVFERDGRRCRHCGAEDDLAIDHIMPRAKGGTDELDNLQVLCRPCNSRKGVSVG